jgi:hypothetical protein
VKEPLTALPRLGSLSKSQPAAELQAVDQQTAKGPIANQQAEKAPEDPPASESLSNGECAADGPAMDLSLEEIPKRPTESSPQDQSIAEHPSEDHTVESPPIIKPAAEALPSSGELSGKTPSRHLPRVL